MTYAIETHELSRQFGQKMAVQNLDLQIPQGSIFAFLGPNGAGKTTTIKMLMNIIPPTHGEAKVLGVKATQLGPKDFEQIGYVSENQEMLEWMTIGNFLMYCRRMYSTWDDEFCGKLVDQFNLSLDQQIKSLSRGMKMKVSLISSLAYRPKLLIFDEPFSGLDPLVRDEFISGVLDIVENKQWTILISSHDIDEVERLADWVGIIDRGSLKLVEQTESLQNRFRRVELTLRETMAEPPSVPEDWFLFKQQDRTVHFFDNAYVKDASEHKYGEVFAECTNVSVFEMSLKEIFIVYARKFKLSDF